MFKNVSVDENDKQVIEFKDREGKVVLKKVQLTANADTGTGQKIIAAGYAPTMFMIISIN